MAKILVGTFRLGMRKYKLFAETENANGRVVMINDNDIGEIVVGVSDQWREVLAVLLHEAYEACTVELGFRYSQDPKFSSESSGCMFTMTHNQFDECHVRVSWFLDEALDKFKKVYDRHHKKKK